MKKGRLKFQSIIKLVFLRKVGASVKVSRSHLKIHDICDNGVVAVARLEGKLNGHAIALIRKDDEQFKGTTN